MKDVIYSVKDFKIIPGNFKSAGEFEFIEADDEVIKGKLVLLDENELDDYKVGSSVEVFGVNNVGLVYFETKITDIDDTNISLAATNDFSIIQRREYSRVALSQGDIVFKDADPDVVLSVEDISAGGIKIISKISFDLEREYDVEIRLSNNMKIDCSIVPIRVKESKLNDKKVYIVSGKFTNLENVDRIVLVQYAFKIKMEEQNKENE